MNKLLLHFFLHLSSFGLFSKILIAQSNLDLENLVSKISKVSGVLFNETKSKVCSASILRGMEIVQAEHEILVTAAHCLDQKEFVKTELIYPQSVIPAGGGSFPFFAVESKEKLYFCLGGLNLNSECLRGSASTVEGNFLVGTSGENFGYSSDVVVLRMKRVLTEKMSENLPNVATKTMLDDSKWIYKYADVYLWALTGSKESGWYYELKPCPITDVLFGAALEGAASQLDSLFVGDCRLTGGKSGGVLLGTREGKWNSLGLAVSSQSQSGDKAVFVTNDRISALSHRMDVYSTLYMTKGKSFFDYMKSREASDDLAVVIGSIKEELEIIVSGEEERGFDSLVENLMKTLLISSEISKSASGKCNERLLNDVSEEDEDTPAYKEFVKICRDFARKERLFESVWADMGLDFARDFPEVFEETKKILADTSGETASFDEFVRLVMRNFSSGKKNTEMNSKELIKKYVFLKMLCEDLDERSDRIRSVFQSHIGWKHGNIEVNFLTDPRVGSNGAGI